MENENETPVLKYVSALGIAAGACADRRDVFVRTNARSELHPALR
jgi:hypothetical protein